MSRTSKDGEGDGRREGGLDEEGALADLSQVDVDGDDFSSPRPTAPASASATTVLWRVPPRLQAGLVSAPVFTKAEALAADQRHAHLRENLILSIIDQDEEPQEQQQQETTSTERQVSASLNQTNLQESSSAGTVSSPSSLAPAISDGLLKQTSLGRPTASSSSSVTAVVRATVPGAQAVTQPSLGSTSSDLQSVPPPPPPTEVARRTTSSLQDELLESKLALETSLHSNTTTTLSQAPSATFSSTAARSNSNTVIWESSTSQAAAGVTEKQVAQLTGLESALQRKIAGENKLGITREDESYNNDEDGDEERQIKFEDERGEAEDTVADLMSSKAKLHGSVSNMSNNNSSKNFIDSFTEIVYGEIRMNGTEKIVSFNDSTSARELEDGNTSAVLSEVMDHYDTEYQLPMAVEVEDTAQEEYVTSAVEFDPDAKPVNIYYDKMLKRRRRSRYAIALGIFITLVVAAGVTTSVVMQRRWQDENAAHSLTAIGGLPTTNLTDVGERELSIKKVLDNALADVSLGNEIAVSSPYNRAFLWIADEDPMQLSADDPAIVQRFILAYFYFASSVNGPWLNCGPSFGESVTDACATYEQTKFYEYLIDENDSNRRPGRRWLSNITECLWGGVSCSPNKHVIKIFLDAEGVSGTFPTGLIKLPFLQAISFEAAKWAANSFSGKPPSQLGTMRNLITCNLQHNNFAPSTIPSSWWTRRKLKILSLSGTNLIGSIPSKIGYLVDLKVMHLFQNKLNGTLPDEMSNCINIQRLYLFENSLEGTSLPESFLNRWNMIDTISFYQNKFSGPLPYNITKFRDTLLFFRFYQNRFSGPIPDGFYTLARLFVLDVGDNLLSGTISPSIINMTKLEQLTIMRNRFQGTLPTELGILNTDELTDVRVEGNNFTGSVPAAMCNRTNYLVFSASCTPDRDGNRLLSCPCCTLCCTSDGKTCVRTKNYRTYAP